MTGLLSSSRFLVAALAAIGLGAGGAADAEAAGPHPAGLIVFARETAAGGSDLWVVRPDGTALRKLPSTDGEDFDPTWTPDGRIVFASPRDSRDGIHEVFSRDLAGREFVRLTRVEPPGSGHVADSEPEVNADGTRVVFARRHADAIDLWSASIVGGDEQRLTRSAEREASPSFGLRGDSLLYERGGWIYRRLANPDAGVTRTIRLFRGTDPAKQPHRRGLIAFVRDGSVLVTWGGRPVRVGAGSAPSWSADGRRLVYAGRDGLYVVDHDGRNRRRITAGRDGAPDWSGSTVPAAAEAAREELAFARNGVVYVVGDDGTALRQLGRGSHPSWSPDGRRLVVASADRLVVVSLDAPGGRTRLGGAGRGFGPAWSPDGRRIAFTSRRTGAFAVFVTNADGSGTRRVTRSSRRGEEAVSPAWSPDGQALVFASTRVGTFNPELYRSRLDGTDLRRLTHTRGGDAVLGDDDVPDWSPDGRRIVFSSNRTGDGALWVMRRDGSGERKLLDFPRTSEWFPRFSPDGARISFTREFPNGRTEIWIARSDGTGARKLLDGADAEWRPRAEAAREPLAAAPGLIAFAKHTGAGGSELYVIRADGTGLRRLSTRPVDADPAWTPDGRRLVFSSRRGLRPGSYELYVRDLAGTTVRRLTRTSRSNAVWVANREPTVAPDGRTVIFAQDVYRRTAWTRDLYRVPIAGGPVQRLTRTPGHEIRPSFGSSPGIVFERDGWIYELLDGAVRRIAQGVHPAKSPTDPRVVAFAFRGGIWVTDGGEPRRVAGATPDGAPSEPAWSPDGSRIVYVAPHGLRVVEVDGSGDRLLLGNAGHAKYRAPAWQPSA